MLRAKYMGKRYLPYYIIFLQEIWVFPHASSKHTHRLKFGLVYEGKNKKIKKSSINFIEDFVWTSKSHFQLRTTLEVG
jgi:hypothetical protein